MKIHIEYQHIQGFNNLNAADKALVAKAQEAALQLSYAPYSRFQVGAALLLQNGEMVQGSNQENAASPAGICAERSALSVASSLYPKMPIHSIAIYYHQPLESQPSNKILSPCGICRQSLMEVAHAQQQHIRILMTSPQEGIYISENLQDLLPFAFSSDFL